MILLDWKKRSCFGTKREEGSFGAYIKKLESCRFYRKKLEAVLTDTIKRNRERKDNF